MKLPDVSGVFDYAGLARDLRCRPRHVAFHQIKSVGALIASFRSSIPSPPVPLFTLRRTPRDAERKNSGPSGSLLLSRRTLAFPASCRFIPAHWFGDLPLVEKVVASQSAEITCCRELRAAVAALYCGCDVACVSNLNPAPRLDCHTSVTHPTQVQPHGKSDSSTPSDQSTPARLRGVIQRTARDRRSMSNSPGYRQLTKDRISFLANSFP